MGWREIPESLFPRLFHLSENSEGKVRDMGMWADGRWEWNIEWRRELFDREKEGAEVLYNLLQKFTIIGVKDRWL